MITRTQAVSVLLDIINSGAFSDMEDDLQDIINCIEAERDWAIHAWDMPDDDWVTLNTAMRTDLPGFDDFIEHQKEIVAEHKFTPSRYEEGSIGLELD